MATINNLTYFDKDYARRLVETAIMDLTSEGQKLAHSIIEKFAQK